MLMIADANLLKCEPHWLPQMIPITESMVLVDSTGRIQRVLSDGLPLFGHDNDPVMGKSLGETFPPEFVELILVQVQEALQSRSPQAFRGAVESLGGTIEITVTPFDLDSACCVFRRSRIQITGPEEKRDTEATETGQRNLSSKVEDGQWDQQEILESLFSNIHLKVAVMDPQFNYLRVNKSYAEMNHWAVEQYFGKNHFDIYPNPKAKALFRTVLETGRAYSETSISFDFPTHPERGINYWDWNLQPLKDAYGKINALILSICDVTEKELAFLALRASEERFRTSVENLLEGFAILSAVRDEDDQIVDFRFEYINEAGCILNQRSREEQLGHTLLEILPRHSDCDLLDAYTRVVETGAPFIREAMMYGDHYGNGEWLSRAFDIRAVKLGDGMSVVWRDVTEQKLTADRLKYQAYLLDNVNDAIIASDQRFKLTAWNLAAESIYGWKAQEVMGEPIQNVLRTKYLDTDQEHFYQILRETGSYSGEVINQHKDGHPINIETKTIALKDEDSSVTGYVSVNRDITDQKAAQEEVARLAAIVEYSDDAIVGISPEGEIISWNKAAERLYGYPPDEALGQAYDLVIPLENSGESDYLMEKLNQGVSLERYETIRMRKDGHRIFVSLTMSPIRNAEGNLIGSSVIARDITEQKKAEQRLRRTAEELSRSNAELEQFAYIASHDLKEPLRMITSYLQLIEKRYKHQLDSDADDFIGFAVDGAARMQRLINDLLAYSRVGKRELKTAQVDCNKIFQQAVSNLKVAISEHESQVTADPLPVILGDDTQLVQLFQNLIGNGIKFQGDQPNHVHVSVVSHGHQWLFSVCDNGIGIDPQYHDRVFGIFQRLHDKDRYPGTGIGLAICKKIIERHGGQIWVESALGEGATFYFTLPKNGEDLE